MGRKLGLDVSQRYEAVMELLRREEPAAAIARRHGICEATLCRLRDEFPATGALRAPRTRRGWSGTEARKE